MSNILTGKVAIVTGGGRGIGRAVAIAYARHGAAVVVAARTQAEIDETVAEIESQGGRVLGMTADVSQAQDVEGMVAKAQAAFGQVDILMNNAGVGGPSGAITELSEADWDQTLAVNLTGVFLCCRAVVPAMIAAGGGNIINMSSGAGQPKPRSAVRSLPYQVSKYGLEGLTNGLAIQLRDHKINVNSLLPGRIATRINFEAPPEWKAAVSTPMAPPEVVVPAALYLATRSPGEFTGQIVSAKDHE